MQKNVALALIIGAVIVGAALFYHAQSLGQLTAQLQLTQQQVAALDANLQSFSRDLPSIIGEAGKIAGREAVHGMAEEAIQIPLKWLESPALKAAGDALRRALTPPPPATPTPSATETNGEVQAAPNNGPA